MYHFIRVGMNAAMLQKLDDMGALYPDANRMAIIVNLIEKAHADAVARNALSGANVVELKRAA